MRKIIVALGVLFLFSCRSALPTGNNKFSQLSATDREVADSMLNYALNHEALYSIRDTLKPISSVKMLRFTVFGDQFNHAGIDSIEMYHRVCRAMSTRALTFLLAPFAAADKSVRNMEVYVVNNRRLASVIASHPFFFGKFGISPSTPPPAVLSIIEYENRYDRWRGYGYLFGYPDHAVDFFVNAGRAEDSTHKFVERDFFEIPVAAGGRGYFTYAVPKGYVPRQIDSLIYRKAMITLNKYLKNKK